MRPAKNNPTPDRLDILILGSAQYSDLSWVNCQHVAAGLARRHRVLFVDSIGLRSPRPRTSDLRRVLRRIGDAAGGVRRIAPNLAVHSPTISARVPALLRRSITASLRTLEMEPTAVIAYLPTWASVVEQFGQARRIYHCVDEFTANPGVDREQLARAEIRLLAASQVVLAVSPPLLTRLSVLHPDVRLLPNVADVERFAAAESGPIPEDVRALPSPRILYLGNLAGYKLDLALLARLAGARPQWSWILVGPIGRGDPDTDLAGLRKLPQVHVLGERDRAVAPAYVASADVCLLPLQGNASTASSAPLKIYEYLAAGRPVVATPIPALEELARAGHIRTATGDEEWLTALEAALREGPGRMAARRAEAMGHGWPARIAEIEALLRTC